MDKNPLHWLVSMRSRRSKWSGCSTLASSPTKTPSSTRNYYSWAEWRSGWNRTAARKFVQADSRGKRRPRRRQTRERERERERERGGGKRGKRSFTSFLASPTSVIVVPGPTLNLLTAHKRTRHAIQRGGSVSYAQISASSIYDAAMRRFRLQTRNARFFSGKRIPRALSPASRSIDRAIDAFAENNLVDSSQILRTAASRPSVNDRLAALRFLSSRRDDSIGFRGNTIVTNDTYATEKNRSCIFTDGSSLVSIEEAIVKWLSEW